MHFWGKFVLFLNFFSSFFCVLRAISAVRAHCAPPKANRVKRPQIPMAILHRLESDVSQKGVLGPVSKIDISINSYSRCTVKRGPQ